MAAEVEVLHAPPALGADEVRRLCLGVLARVGAADDAHLAVAFVDEEQIAALNARWRGREAPTDVLSFPVDGAGAAGPGVELGDVVICAARCSDVREAVVHGVLHLLGHDHETDDGEMLALQDSLMAELTS